MRSSLREGPEDWVYDALAPNRCHACEQDPIGPPSLQEAATEQSPNIKVTIGRKEVRLCEYHAKALISMLQKELNKEYSRRKDAYEHECPVCGQRNKRETYYEDGIGLVESHYFCDNCGFADEMAYSPGYTTFVKGGKLKDRFKRWKVRWKNWKKTLRVMLGDDFSAKLGKYI